MYGWVTAKFAVYEKKFLNSRFCTDNRFLFNYPCNIYYFTFFEIKDGVSLKVKIFFWEKFRVFFGIFYFTWFVSTNYQGSISSFSLISIIVTFLISQYIGLIKKNPTIKKFYRN